jgi:hypothetical protein
MHQASLMLIYPTARLLPHKKLPPPPLLPVLDLCIASRTHPPHRISQRPGSATTADLRAAPLRPVAREGCDRGASGDHYLMLSSGEVYCTSNE